MTSSADRDLLLAYLDGTLPDAGLRALEDRLRVEPALSEALVGLAREEAILKEWACASQAAEGEPGLDRKTVLPHPMVRLSLAGRSPWRRVVLGIAASAALIALAVLGIAFLGRHPEPVADSAIAHVEEVQGEVYVVSESGEPTPARSGQPLAYGEKLRTQGDGSSAVLTFPDQSRLELGADTTIQLNSSPPTGPESPTPQIYLEQGQVAANAPRQSNDQPMILQTPHAEAYLSGRLSVASQPNETRIEPENGKIQFKRKSDGRSIEVRPGEYAVAGPNRQFAPKRVPVRIAEVHAIKGGPGPVSSASFSADGSILATGSADGTIKLWDVASGVQRQIIRAHTKPVRAVAFSPVGPLLASGNDGKILKFWDPISGEQLAALKAGKANVDCLAFSPDGSLLVTAGGAGRSGADIHLWDVAQRKELASWTGHRGGTAGLAFSPDGRTLATAGRDSTIKLWDVAARQLRQTLVGHAARVNAVAFSPDGTLLASAGADRMVRLWDPATGVEKPPLSGHRGEVRAVAFAPDGKTLASADNNVTFWDMPGGTERVTFKGHKRHVTALAFSPDGKVLATTSVDQMIRLWDPTRAVR